MVAVFHSLFANGAGRVVPATHTATQSKHSFSVPHHKQHIYGILKCLRCHSSFRQLQKFVTKEPIHRLSVHNARRLHNTRKMCRKTKGATPRSIGTEKLRQKKMRKRKMETEVRQAKNRKRSNNNKKKNNEKKYERKRESKKKENHITFRNSN